MLTRQSLMRQSFVRVTALGTAFALLGVTALHSQAAPPATTPSANVQLDAKDKQVVERLTWLINKRMKGTPAATMKLKIVPTGRASEGYFSQISISAAPAKVKRMYVSQFSLDAKNVKLDVPYLLSERKIRTAKAATTFQAMLTDDDITRMLADGKNTKAMGLKVKFLPGVGNKMRVTGNLNYALLNGPVDGVGTLRRTPDSKVFLDISSLKLRGVETPAFVKNWLANHINPIIDYNDLPFNPQFKSFKIVGNKAYIST